MIREITGLLYKELLLEWKEKYAFNGLLMYVLSMIFVISFAFKGNFEPKAWNSLFWIILLFVAVNAIAKSFIGERSGQLLYQYTLAHPASVIISKMLYNGLVMLCIAGVSQFFYFLFSGKQLSSWINDPGYYFLLIALGSLGFSANLTLVAAIASKARNKATMIAVLGFPLTVPLLLNSINGCWQAMQGVDRVKMLDEVVFSAGFIVIIATVSVILFPFLWRE